MPTVTIAITSGTRWRVPVDCTSATIEVIGGGGFGGGAYSKTNSVTLTPLSFAYINVGAGGYADISGSTIAGDTWFNKATNAAPSSTTNGALAKGGGDLPDDPSGPAPGGNKTLGIGDTKNSGGDGFGRRYFSCGDFYNEVGSYGGSAGPNGDGGSGRQAYSGGGGGANGGSSSTTSTGGNNRLGTGGGTGGALPTAGTGGGGGGGNTSSGAGGAGSADLIWTDYLGNTYGPAGGAGGTSSVNNLFTSGVNYGGGGSTGGQGLIIITYTPVVTIGNSYTEVLNESGSTGISTPSRWRIPYGVDTVTVHAIGSGSSGATVTTWGGGGGGAYATSAVDVSTLNNTGAYYLNYFSDGSFFGGSDAWFNKSASSAPSVATNGALAKGAAAGSSTGGASGSSVGEAGKVFAGGNGGSGGGTTVRKVGGGGGAAGPNGVGGTGGNVFSVTNASGSSGGGGGANGGTSRNAGNAGTAIAGAGGANSSGTGAGAAATATTNAGNGSNGGGGGGGKNTNGTFLNGGNGSTQNIWTDSGTSSQYGPGGGGGGSAATNTTNIGTPGAAGQWGGGTGFFRIAGHPLIVLQYTIVKAAPVDPPSTGNMFMMFN